MNFLFLIGECDSYRSTYYRVSSQKSRVPSSPWSRCAIGARGTGCHPGFCRWLIVQPLFPLSFSLSFYLSMPLSSSLSLFPLFSLFSCARFFPLAFLGTSYLTISSGAARAALETRYKMFRSRPRVDVCFITVSSRPFRLCFIGATLVPVT